MVFLFNGTPTTRGTHFLCFLKANFQLPSGLFWALAEEHRENYKEIKVDFHSAPVGCLLYSLFELGLFDADLAVNLLNKGAFVSVLYHKFGMFRAGSSSNG